MSRAALDLYPTDPLVCDAVLTVLDGWGMLPGDQSVIEPHVGLWRWVEALDRFAERTGRHFDVWVHDLDPAHLERHDAHSLPNLASVHKLPPGDWLLTARQLAEKSGAPFDLAIGNPPFAVVAPGQKRGQVVAHHHVNATRLVCVQTAMLVRSQLWSASTDRDRLAFAADAPTHRIELAPRPGFTDDGALGPFASTVAVWGQGRRSNAETMTRMCIWRPELLAQPALSPLGAA